jgi:hypothetical protein
MRIMARDSDAGYTWRQPLDYLAAGVMVDLAIGRPSCSNNGTGRPERFEKSRAK